MQFKASQRLRNPNEENLNVKERNNVASTSLVQPNEALKVDIFQPHECDLRQKANPSSVAQSSRPQGILQQQQSDQRDIVDNQRTTVCFFIF
uniref:Uncharacterized protein n=1 Tax=Panagrolaimus sp. ES5 TaxID=591445 RepID=A0AC34GWG7_9BILA